MMPYRIWWLTIWIKISAITGSVKYRPFDYYGAADAENIIIAMGSVTETIREVIDYENANGQKVGYDCSSPVSPVLC